MKRKDGWAGESDEEAANIDGRAIIELGPLAWNQPEEKAQKKGDNLLKFQANSYPRGLGEKEILHEAKD